MSAKATTVLKRALPWLLSLVIVGYLFWSVDSDAVLAAVQGADLQTLVWVMVLSAPLILLADAATLWLLFSRLIARLPFREVVAIKGVSYFFNAITYSAGTGGIAYLVHRRTQGRDLEVAESRPVGGFLHVLSSLLWLNFIDIIALLLLIGAGLILAHDHVPPQLAEQLPYVLVGGAVIVVGALIYWRAGVDFLVLGPLRSWRIFRSFADAQMADYGVMVSSRVAFVGVYIILTWLLLPTFQIEVPFLLLLVYMPIGTFVQIVPASVSGLGAVQVVMIALYAPHVASSIPDGEAQVLAFTTFLGPATTFIRVLLGYLFLKTVMTRVMGGVTLDAAAIAEARRADEGH